MNRLRAGRTGIPACGRCHQPLADSQPCSQDQPSHRSPRNNVRQGWRGRLLPIQLRVKLILAACGLIALVAVLATFSPFKAAKAPSTTPSISVTLPETDPAKAAALSPTEVFRRASPSVFVVEVMDSQNRIVGTGSGVAVGEGQVITNKHVASGGRLRLRHGDRVWTPHRVVKHPERDLALLMVEDLNVPSVRIETTVSVGDRVYAIGAPKGLELTFSEGLVSSIRSGRLIQTSAPISSGSSGGGLFDGHGNLVGITTGGFEDG